MPCFHPITAWRSSAKTAAGKRPLLFTPNGAVGLPLEINCGQCIGCRLERARQWSVRIMHEAQFHEETSFLTLTYSPQTVPASGSVVVRDLQLFFKRLRRSLPSKRLRYFAVGEYGDRLSRPHYHAILFGWAFLPDRKRWKQGVRGDDIYVSESLDKLWGLGDCYIGSVTLQSAGYVARYHTKKVLGDRAEAHYNGLHPEFMVCSKGIGSEWFSRFSSDVFPDDFVVFKGKQMAVPKYYERKLDESVLAPIKEERLKRSNKHWRNQTPERLAVREEVQQAKAVLLKRE